MRNPRASFRLLQVTSAAVVGVVLIATVALVAVAEYRVDAAKPRLDGTPSSITQALRLPSPGFPDTQQVERAELRALVPADPPIRSGSVPAWGHLPVHPLLGGPGAGRNTLLRNALSTLAQLDASRREEDVELDATMVATARRELVVAEMSLAPAARWLTRYNRGVLYRWQGNRQKAATEFEAAYRGLPALAANSPDEVRSARIHVLYAWGDSLIKEADGGTTVSVAAIERLRDAALEVASYARSSAATQVAHAAEFFQLEPTQLPTSAIRNDLIASYLAIDEYASCTRPFSLDVCAVPRRSGGGRCQYRDTSFCAARDKASDGIRQLFDAELTRLHDGAKDERRAWALQNVAEIESENVLEGELDLSYNIAHLLLGLEQPALAYDYITRITEASDQGRVTPAMQRMAFVTSVLAGKEPTGLGDTWQSPPRQGLLRTAYLDIYPSDVMPRPFPPLPMQDASKTEALDAWLFVRRYRLLLEQANLEGFLAEHRQLAAGAPSRFLHDWKTAVAVAYVKRAVAAREQATADVAAQIDALLARTDLFTDEEFAAAGAARPFVWNSLRGGLYVGALGIVAGLAAMLWWLCAAYDSAFISRYNPAVVAARGAVVP